MRFANRWLAADALLSAVVTFGAAASNHGPTMRGVLLVTWGVCMYNMVQCWKAWRAEKALAIGVSHYYPPPVLFKSLAEAQAAAGEVTRLDAWLLSGPVDRVISLAAIQEPTGGLVLSAIQTTQDGGVQCVGRAASIHAALADLCARMEPPAESASSEVGSDA